MHYGRLARGIFAIAMICAGACPSALAQRAAPPLSPNLGWLNTDRPLSLDDELEGHVVLLDFWTYCCINCIHILPDLHYLEEKYADEPFVVIGVHSAKFEDEEKPENVRQAMLRYDIRHPVVVDHDMQIWRKYGVRAWPSFVLIGADGNVVGYASGEGQRDILDQAVDKAIETAKDNGTLAEKKVEFELVDTNAHLETARPLSYPGKVHAAAPQDDFPGALFIADSSNNRVIHAAWPDENGKASVVTIYGNAEASLADGSAASSSFHDPQGFVFDRSSNTLYVADTKNHAVRAIDLDEQTVRTIAGNGEQGYDRSGGKRGRAQVLSSPWALELSQDAETLYVAMAGLHQLWSIDLANGQAAALVGSGRENIVDNRFASAQLAQPSGLALAPDATTLYFADSEVSAIRSADVESQQVSTHIGTGLFDFGDIDGSYPDARLQHVLGVTIDPGAADEYALLIADTYNNKIKRVFPADNRVESWLGPELNLPTGAEPTTLDEPAGLHLDGDRLFIADTNHHRVIMVDRATRKAAVISIEGLDPPAAGGRSQAPGGH